MKALVISPYFYPHKGGSQQYMEEIYFHTIKKYSDISVDILAYNTDSAPTQEVYRGMNIYRVPCFEILRGQFAIPNYFLLWKTISKLFQKNKYEFINVNTRFFESAWWAPFIANHFGAKTILTDHCATHPEHPNYIIRKIAEWVDLLIVPFISKYYDTVVVTNKATKKFLETLNVKKINVIYGGVDTQLFKPQTMNTKRLIGNKTLSERDILISFVGRMIHSKGPQLLFKAAETILNKYPNAYLVFVGDGEMKKKIQPLNTNDRIIFTGSLEKEQIAEVMSKTDILVHPSLHHEGFPNVLLEASATGCAIIATDKGGSTEIILNNKTGIIAEPTVYDLVMKLSELISNKQLRNKLQINARKHTETNFSWNNIVSGFYNLLSTKIS